MLNCIKCGKKLWQFDKKVDPKVILRAKNCETQLIRHEILPLRYTFRSKCHESYSKGPWLSKISIKDIVGTKNPNIKNMNIGVSCNCPYFLYWGPYYNNRTKQDLAPNAQIYKDPEPKYRAKKEEPPDVRDPGRQHFLCKHLKNAIALIESKKVDVLEGFEEMEELKKRQPKVPAKPTPKKPTPPVAPKPTSPIPPTLPTPIQPTVPEVKVPEKEIPEVKVPERKIPEVKVPERKIPEIKVPGRKIPEVKVPERKIPEIKMPEKPIPKVPIPQRPIPKIPVPKPTLPTLKKPVQIPTPVPKTKPRFYEQVKHLLPTEKKPVQIPTPVPQTKPTEPTQKLPTQIPTLKKPIPKPIEPIQKTIPTPVPKTKPKFYEQVKHLLPEKKPVQILTPVPKVKATQPLGGKLKTPQINLEKEQQKFSPKNKKL